jgi:hypothetical protein
MNIGGFRPTYFNEKKLLYSKKIEVKGCNSFFRETIQEGAVSFKESF